MEITINGQKKPVTNNLTVAQLLTDLGLDSDQVVIELNHAILANDDYAQTQLNDADVLELIQFVGGG
jgi:thiamine biosynthesis protein ThiS